MIVIHRDTDSVVSSSVGYFLRRGIISNNKIAYELDALAHQMRSEDYLSMLKKEFDLLEYQFNDVVNDQTVLSELLDLIGLKPQAELPKVNSSSDTVRFEFLGSSIITVYRFLRDYIPKPVVRLLSNSELIQKIVFSKNTNLHDDDGYTDDITKNLKRLLNKTDGCDAIKGKN